MKSEKRQKGFTLIELITVIVILALLAVFAIPRYLEALAAARKSTILGVEGALQSAVALVKARAKLEGDESAGTVALEKGEGGTVAVTTTSQLVPTANAAGMGAAIDLRDTQSEITVGYGTDGAADWAGFAAADAPDPDNCRAVYWITLATGVATINTYSSGC